MAWTNTAIETTFSSNRPLSAEEMERVAKQIQAILLYIEQTPNNGPFEFDHDLVISTFETKTMIMLRD